MYRYSVNNTITYTPDDLVLFRESPFAAWMERLTLENPEHGIPTDLDSNAVTPSFRRQDAIVATLRAEGRNVVLIDPHQDEPDRRAATLETMRVGADFIVCAHLSVGNLAGTADMLMRTSGYSELGDFLYIPCETHADSTLQSAFRLCFLADLLENLQGQLPPQLLIIRGGSEVVPLQTDDHVYYYRAVQKRFIAAMQGFRKHRMPDPAESAHFGRWGECASEVLKQRDVSEQQRLEEQQQLAEQAPEAMVEVPQLRVASGTGATAQRGVDPAARAEFSAASNPGNATARDHGSADRGDFGITLAEQARLLKPGSYHNDKPPGHTPSLAHIGKPRVVSGSEDAASEPVVEPSATDTLENLEFIGSGPGRISSEAEFEMGFGEMITPAPAPNLREITRREPPSHPQPDSQSSAAHLVDLEPRAPVFLPPDEERFKDPPAEHLATRPWEEADTDSDASSVIDLDAAPASTLAPVVQRAEAVFERLFRDDPMFKKVSAAKPKASREDDDSRDVSPFSNSLKTSEEFNDS
jgi:hypothetical protein